MIKDKSNSKATFIGFLHATYFIFFPECLIKNIYNNPFHIFDLSLVSWSATCFHFFNKNKFSLQNFIEADHMENMFNAYDHIVSKFVWLCKCPPSLKTKEKNETKWFTIKNSIWAIFLALLNFCLFFILMWDFGDVI